MSINVRIIRPSSRERNSSLLENLDALEASGFKVNFEDTPFEGGWNFTSNSAEIRAKEFNEALSDEKTDIIWASRGGYGASDLLSQIDWDFLEKKKVREKTLIGFSDITALHSALYTKLGWQGIHGPMPVTALWNKHNVDGTNQDIQTLFNLLHGRISEVSIPLFDRHNSSFTQQRAHQDLKGWLFGGCFSVLTNLIGTPYFPKSLKGSILFLEDTSEHPARLLRYLNQWVHSGVLTGVKGIILGQILDESPEQREQSSLLAEEFEQRCQIPVFSSNSFGHLSPNFPLQIGAEATISHNEKSEGSTEATLTWTSNQFSNTTNVKKDK